MGQNTVGANFGVVSVHDFLTQLDLGIVMQIEFVVGATSMMKKYEIND